MVIIPTLKIEFESNPWMGILKYIRTQSGSDDPHSSGIVNVSASSVLQGSPNIPITTDEDRIDRWWCSHDSVNSWYQISFLEHRVSLSSYSYRSHSKDFFSEWNVHGSDDGLSWEILHHQPYFAEPVPTQYYTFQFTINNTKTKKIIRFSPKAKRYYGTDHFCIHGIEFFGLLVSPYDFYGKACTHSNCRSTIFVIVINFIGIFYIHP